MKIFVILLCLLLSGCGAVPEEAAQAATAAVVETAAETAVETLPPETTVFAEPEDADFVRVLDYLPGAVQELRYAREDNFTGQVVYDFTDAYLRYGTVKKLQAACADLAELGLTVKIWDGFRPVAAQFALWEVCPDSRYVANPNTGFSSHSRGNTVDLTLVWADGTELEMPTGFDDFSAKADRDYSDCTEDARNHALILESVLEKHGFVGYAGEWWHFSDRDSYPVEEAFSP